MSDEQVYEIANPSDYVTIKTDNEMAACMAGMLLGEGKYGVRRVADDMMVCPMFLFGGSDEWAEKTYQLTVQEILDRTREALPAILRTAVCGNRDDYERTTESRQEWNERKRGSMNNICGYADIMADRIEKLNARAEKKETAVSNDPA